MSSYDPYRNGYASHDVLLDHDYPRWAYIILYLVVLICGILLNGFFLWTVSKNRVLHRTVHYFLTCLAVRDVFVCVAVIPFVIHNQAINVYDWTAGDGLCKMFSFLDWTAAGVHAFTLLFLLLFLYYWYRKNEAYMTEDGQTVVRKNRMHKWAIPLAWVLGVGLAIPAASVANVYNDPAARKHICSAWNPNSGSGGTGYWFVLGRVIAGFAVPAAVMFFPVIALGMQISGARTPRLDPPHDRLASTALGLFVIFLLTRGPSEVYTVITLFSQSVYYSGLNRYKPWAPMAFSTEMIISAIVYTACVLDPLLYFVLNPDYRAAFKYAWTELYCNKDPVERERQREERRLRKQQEMAQRQARRPFGMRNRAPPNARQQQEALLAQRQPIIKGAQAPGGQQFHYPQPPHQQPLLQQGVMLNNPQLQQLQPDQHFLDTSFERLSPQLPPVFEYDGLKYIDTARVEPRIGYSPEKTPPKTPETPHYRLKPFVVPGVTGPIPPALAAEMQAQAIANSPIPPGAAMEMTEISPGQQAEQRRPDSFQLENLEGSPGANLRSRRLREDLDESVDLDDALDEVIPPREPLATLQESPGEARRHRQATQESQQSSGYQSTNGTGVNTSRPTSPGSPTQGAPPPRPSSRGGEGVEIVITGRTRSRTDLCPDVPRSKFEHSV